MNLKKQGFSLFSKSHSILIPKKKKKINFLKKNYVCIIKSHDVRHVKKRHPDDINYICEIPEIIENFYSVKKSITKDFKRGSSLINLEFCKKIW